MTEIKAVGIMGNFTSTQLENSSTALKSHTPSKNMIRNMCKYIDILKSEILNASLASYKGFFSFMSIMLLCISHKEHHALILLIDTIII